MHQLTCVDWRTASPETMRPLYSAEQGQWASLLYWDSTSSWEEVERGRQLGTVQGFVVTNGRHDIAGWTFFVVSDGALQVGGFVSSSEACTTVMLDAILGDLPGDTIDAITFFTFASAPGLVPALKSRRLSVCRYFYLSRESAPAPSFGLPRDARVWRPDDVPATADLLMNAYRSPDSSRPFAPYGAPEDWRRYVSRLVTSNGCGKLIEGASLCVSSGPGRLAAVALVSRVSANTGHLVQLAVDPGFRRQGVGATLLEAACRAAGRAGCERMTLFVGGSNSGARALYEGARFETRANFIAAGSFQPRRLTSVAPGTWAATLR